MVTVACARLIALRAVDDIRIVARVRMRNALNALASKTAVDVPSVLSAPRSTLMVYANASKATRTMQRITAATASVHWNAKDAMQMTASAASLAPEGTLRHPMQTYAFLHVLQGILKNHGSVSDSQI